MSQPGKKSYGSRSGETIGYVVEARSTFHDSQLHFGQTFDNRWKRVEFMQHPLGIINQLYCRPAEEIGLLSYEAAMALARWFLCPCLDDRESIHGIAIAPLCLEVRLVKVKCKYSISTEEIGVGEAINRFEEERAAKFVERAGEV